MNLIRFKILSTDSLIDSVCLGHNLADQCTLWQYDTIEVSVAPFDTHSTLSSGWEYLQARAWGSLGLIRVSGIANI